MKTKYEILLHILDQLRKEAPSTSLKYKGTTPDEINQARSLAYIHLFLKARFGLMNFKDRISYVTDGSFDGGIDAYFIDEKSKTIFIIQSKFRTNEKNFQNKEIAVSELDGMDTDRILKGEKTDNAGNSYNGKILGLQRAISELPSRGKYTERVIILANLITYDKSTAKKLVGGFEVEVFDYSRAYNELVFPICCGTYYNPEELTISIKTEDGKTAHHTQTIATKFGNCIVRLIFVPASEIAHNVGIYRNSLLKYNPRNFLSFAGEGSVNKEIRESLSHDTYNDFALLNNGITIFAQSDAYSDRTAEKGIGKLTITKPQIINGGQTAFSLYKIMDERGEAILKNKTVLVKVITPEDGSTLNPDLIQLVSEANNKQAKIVEADRRSNAKRFIEIQQHIFQHYDLLFERKRGEFGEGISAKYIRSDQVIKRVEFVRNILAFNGNPAKVRTSAQDYIFEESLFEQIMAEPSVDIMMCAFYARQFLKPFSKKSAGTPVYAILAALGVSVDRSKITAKNAKAVASQITLIVSEWERFEKYAVSKQTDNAYVKSGVLTDRYYKGRTVDTDIIQYFEHKNIAFNYS